MKKEEACGAILTAVREFETGRRNKRLLRRQLDNDRRISGQPTLIKSCQRWDDEVASIGWIEEDHVERQGRSAQATDIGTLQVDTVRSAQSLEIAPGEIGVLIDQPYRFGAARPGFKADGTGTAKKIEKTGIPDQSRMVQNVEKSLACALARWPDGMARWARETLATIAPANDSQPAHIPSPQSPYRFRLSTKKSMIQKKWSFGLTNAIKSTSK
jgi:hypothetical protein